jgi:hypothetical protein
MYTSTMIPPPRPFTELNNSFTDQSNMFGYMNTEEFAWNKGEDEDKEDDLNEGETGLPS